jgi:hypothetical protein
MAISVYQYPQVLHLTVGNLMHNCARGQHMIVSQHYTNSLVRLFRNTDQRIDLLLKDWDRRAVKFEEWQHVWFKLYDGTREIMEKEAELIDFDKGHYVLEFSKLDTGSLELGNFSWCIVVKDTDLDTTSMLWTNQDYGAHAPCNVIEGPLPIQPEATIIDLTGLTDLVSSALPGAAQTTNPAGVHSLVFKLDAFTGSIDVEGSLDADIPATAESWVPITAFEYATQTGTHHESVVGNYNWIRLKFSGITGLDEVAYRNA